MSEFFLESITWNCTLDVFYSCKMPLEKGFIKKRSANLIMSSLSNLSQLKFCQRSAGYFKRF